MPYPSHAEESGLRLAFLGSGSAGNSTAVVFGGTTVLVDAGFSARETLRRLDESDIDATSVRAIIITHEHSDHVRGVRVLAARLGVPVYATPGTRTAATLDTIAEDPRDLTPGEPIAIGGISVLPFTTSHDAAEPVGVRFDAPDGTSFGLATDTGELTPESLEALAGCDLLALECNHDIDMLMNGPYPWFLKNRIASAHGHLSNDAAAAGLEHLAHGGLRYVVAVHVSNTNNTHEQASEALTCTLRRLGHPAAVGCVSQACVHIWTP